MTNQSKYELILTIVNRGFASDVMDSARAAGAQGGTLLHARGSGIKEAQEFFGITIHPEKDIALILVRADQKVAVMQEICKHVGLDSPGRGLSMSLPVDDVVGLPALLRNGEE